MNQLLSSLQWRYAVKQFDKDKRVSSEDIDYLKSAIQLAPSSYGLQAYRVFIINDSTLRTQLKEASWGQSQITDASHLFVFSVYQNLTDDFLTDCINTKANIQKLDKSGLVAYKATIQHVISAMSIEERLTWLKKQTYIALTHLLVACAYLHIDACPFEGFKASEYDRILGLGEEGLTTSLVAAVGYRSKEDITQSHPKVRRSKEELFSTK